MSKNFKKSPVRCVLCALIPLVLAFPRPPLQAAPPSAANPSSGLVRLENPPRERRADRILAMPLRSPGSLRQRTARAKIGAKIHRSFPSAGGLEVLKIPVTTPVEFAIAELRATGAYEYVEPDYIVRASGIPNDPQFGNLWGMHNTGQSGGISDTDTDAPEGWDLRTSSDSVVVGVIDSGVRHTHEDLAANMWVNPGESGEGRETNGIDDDGNGYIDDVHGINAITGSGNPMDDHGHGSHVAGTIGAVGNNAVGVAGVAWTTRIMALKFLGADGSGSLSDAIECIDYARAHGAQVTNNSWGGGGYSQALMDAIRAAGDAGSVFVAAAGNNSNDNSANPSYPASYLASNVLAVGGYARDGSLYSETNYGFGLVDLAGPAVDILSTSSASDSAYAWMTGTSMATPHVSGIAALVRAQFPGESPRQTIHRIQRAVERVEAWKGKFTFPGRANLRMALEGTSSAPPNDNFTNAIEMPADGARVRASMEGATIEAGESPLPGTSGEGTLWWKWTAPSIDPMLLSTHASEADTILAVFTGSSLSGLSLVGSNDDSTQGTTSELQFSPQAGTTYWIAVAAKTGELLELKLSGARPPNDLFADRVSLAGSAILASGTNENATSEPGEPLNTWDSGGHTVWWEWTSPISGRVEILTEGSSYDSTLGVYSGSTVGALTPLDTNDDVILGFIRTSRVLVDVTAGQKLQIQVDGWDTETGPIQLWLFAEPPPANDNFANAATLPSLTVNSTGGAATTYGETYYALREPGEPEHASPGHSSIWWKWTAPVSGNVTINLDGSNFYTLLGVYEGSSLGALSPVASDSADSEHARVSFAAVAGRTYRIAVDGIERSAGFATLNFAIQNTRPSMSAPILSPSGTAFSDEELAPANLAATDPENDPVSFAFQWQFSTDGVVYQDAVGENSIALAPNSTRSGKWWRCRIVPSDALGPGEPVFSDSVIVDNRPPSTARVGSAFSYNCDLPGSALFEIGPGVVLPPGLLVNSRTGILYGTPEEGAEGLHTVRLLRGGLAREFDLLIGSAEGIYRVPAGREWMPPGPVQIEGILVVEGSLAGDQPIQIEQTYSAWSLLHLGLISTPQDAFDSDGDGVSDFAEFAFGGNPARVDSTPSPPTAELTGQSAAISFAKQKDPSPVDYVVERSRDLVEWNPLPDAPVVFANPVDHATEIITVRDTDPIDEAPVFLRVWATMK